MTRLVIGLSLRLPTRLRSELQFTSDNVGSFATSFSGFRYFLSQKENPKILWKDSDTIQDIITTELVVSGVYLKLFISNPGWTLRKPKQFLSDLLDFVAENISRSGGEVWIILTIE